MVNFVAHVTGIFQVLQVPVVINFPGKPLCTSHIAASTGGWGSGGVWGLTQWCGRGGDGETEGREDQGRRRQMLPVSLTGPLITAR